MRKLIHEEFDWWERWRFLIMFTNGQPTLVVKLLSWLKICMQICQIVDTCDSRVTFVSANLRFLSQKFHLPIQAPKRGSSHGYHRMTKEYLGRLPVMMMMIWISGGKSWRKLAGTSTPRMAVTWSLMVQLPSVSLGGVFEILTSSILNLYRFHNIVLVIIICLLYKASQ